MKSAKLALAMLALFAQSALALNTVSLDCDLTRTQDSGHRVSHVQLSVSDQNPMACSTGKETHMETCYSMDVGNFILKIYKDDGKTLLNTVTTKFGSGDWVPAQFEMISQLGEGNKSESFAAACLKKDSLPKSSNPQDSKYRRRR